MPLVSRDRGEILHFAGFHHLSPALDAERRPALSTSATDGLARCGWESFFRALDEGRLALSFEPSDPGSARFVPSSAARGPGGRRIRAALVHARRFLAAMSGPRDRARARLDDVDD